MPLPCTYRGKVIDGIFVGGKGWEGPIYADRVGGKLTFRDWDSWYPEDQEFFKNDRNPHDTGKAPGGR